MQMPVDDSPDAPQRMPEPISESHSGVPPGLLSRNPVPSAAHGKTRRCLIGHRSAPEQCDLPRSVLQA
jgi:hypothetical protein